MKKRLFDCKQAFRRELYLGTSALLRMASKNMHKRSDGSVVFKERNASCQFAKK